jgi:alpha-2-macroglobulin
LLRSYAWVGQAIRQIGERNEGYYANAPDATRAYAAYVLARAGRADIGELRRMHDTAQWAVLANGAISPASVHWGQGQGDDSLAAPLSLGHLAGALSLMGDHARAHSAFALALANLELQRYPNWWFHHLYYSETRDMAGLIAVAAESGEAQTAATLLDRFGGRSLSAESLNTQEKASLLAAAHALSTDARARSLSINGKEMSQLKLPAAFAPTLADIEHGYHVVNTSERALWRTLVIRGAPKQAPSAMEHGYWLSRRYFGLDGTPVDPAHLVQNDRILVSLTGRAQDDNDHRTVLVDMLPAGWEIEAPVTRAQEYAFLGPLSKPQIVEARDDRFVAAFDLGDAFDKGRRHRWWRYTERNDAEPQLERDEFSLAYVVRVVTPGRFALPAAVVEDMYRPGVMARTDAGATTADAR